ncbi:MAG: acyl-CoA dehydrogenase [Bacillati bacterium ANGP1]|uniref:Acyl-CoA dehydrogenase n=1 Tax=Candidatus Segetimicrobium genomatis TaxID=2569760 RepID=A0A537LX82_9BACT|nr:MAG: acyl-CoA dehydrogenase [Terrabacteria group bacterium ANGP1]
MDFQLADEHRMVQATVREFARQEILPRAAALDHTPVFPSEIIQKAAALGLMGMVIPEAYGGAGMDPVSYVVAQEELARASAGLQTIITVNNSLVCDPIFHFGTEDQKRRYLPRLSSGASLGCYCLTEPAYGSDAMSLRTDARREADQWILRGTKAFVTNAVEADVCIVYARTGPEPGARGISAFIVEKGFPGISVGKVEKKLGIKCSSTAEIVLDGCRVPASNLLGEPGSGGKIALTTLDGGRLGIAAQAVGIARAALEEATAYAAGRRQFGRSIGEFQAIQWMLADMATRTDAARLLMLRAAYLRQQGTRYTREASMAKLFASETAMWVTHKAVQIFGGYGYIQDYPVERYFRDAKITEIYEGTSEIQRIVIARNLLEGHA